MMNLYASSMILFGIGTMLTAVEVGLAETWQSRNIWQFISSSFAILFGLSSVLAAGSP